MENGGVGHDRDGELTGKFSYDRDGELTGKFASLALGNEINGSPHANDGLFQVMKAVEAAEATIKQQVEENNRLRFELQRKTQELEKHKSDNLSPQIPHFVDNWDESFHEPQKAHQSVSPLANQAVGHRGVDNSSTPDPSGTVALQKVLVGRFGDPLQTFQDKYKNSKIDGPLRMLPGGQAVSDNTHISQLSSPSSSSVSPGRYQMEREYDPRFSLPGQRLLPMAETKNSISLLNQDLVAKIREHQEEILRLRKHLAEYSIKEAKIRNEKYVLEKRIAYMRMAFDQQQQDLVDAASKAISYRQDIIEKNIHLTYALQDAQQERSIFVSSLMPLLAEYSFQPPVADAESIVSNVKVLFKHLQEKLILTEAKLNESEYQLAPMRSDANSSNLAASQSHSGNKNGLVLVPQPTYSSGQIALSSDPLPTRGWDLLGSHQSVSDVDAMKNLTPDTLGRYSPIASRNTRSPDVPTQFDVSQGNSHPGRNKEETTTKHFTLSDRVSSREMDDPDMDGHHNEREAEINWGSKNNSYTLQDDPSSSYSPYLPPVLEEPTSSFSEAADDDPIPAIEGLQISGEAFPGFELQASGYSINGTTSCNFEWVRHLEDGSVNYIDGAKQPNYLVTADDVGTYLAIEVQPLDDRKRKGELVKVFANDHKKINCDPEMQSYIEKTLYSGHASCRVSLSQVGYLDIWEPATLAIKREGYSIKCSGPSGIITEKFTPATVVMIPYGNPTEFSIISSGGTERLLRIDNSTTDIVGSRDTIVLALRLFIIRAGEKRKGKKRGIFFK